MLAAHIVTLHEYGALIENPRREGIEPLEHWDGTVFIFVKQHSRSRHSCAFPYHPLFAILRSLSIPEAAILRFGGEIGTINPASSIDADFVAAFVGRVPSPGVL
jgi:hypothetical protein